MVPAIGSRIGAKIARLSDRARRHWIAKPASPTPPPLLLAVDLARELSGVLCRCTGYNQIVQAVRDVAASYPDGQPPPGNTGHDPALAARARATTSRIPGEARAREP